MSKSPPEDVNCYKTAGKVTAAIFFTDLSGDRVPAAFGMVQGMHVNGTGAIQAIEFGAIHCASGGVWRFSGSVNPIPGIRIIADPIDPLSFYLMETVGPVFLSGRGRVVDTDGSVLFEAGKPIQKPEPYW